MLNSDFTLLKEKLSSGSQYYKSINNQEPYYDYHESSLFTN
uniref:Uncharacterized protein n=2 Tax=Klebsiella TaxID=570 RepID=A0A1J0QZS9_KLEPN|nr:hypothetical protein [Klebsiella pneumoniae]AVX35289.1 Hypothetical protein [Klebsiella aerogenes]QVQ58461.1 hypothetical protein [Klebsiella pneumoniae]